MITSCHHVMMMDDDCGDNRDIVQSSAPSSFRASDASFITLVASHLCVHIVFLLEKDSCSLAKMASIIRNMMKQQMQHFTPIQSGKSLRETTRAA